MIIEHKFGPASQRDFLDEYEAGQLANDFDFATPEEVIGWALDRWHSRLAICTSFQAEGMAILDMAWRIDPEVRLFTVDTGRLPQETSAGSAPTSSRRRSRRACTAAV